MKNNAKLGLICFSVLTLMGMILAYTTLMTLAQEIPIRPSLIRWSPDGSRIALSGHYGLRIFRSDLTLHPVQIPERTTLRAMAWSSDGKYLAISRYTKVRVWDVDMGVLIYERDVSEVAYSLTWSPDGRYLAIADGGYQVIVLNTKNWDVSKILFDSGRIIFISWNPAGDRLLAQGDANLIVWNTLNWEITFKDNIGIASDAIGWSPSGRQFVVPGGAILATDQDGEEATVICTQNFSPEFAAWSRDGSRIALTSSDQAGSSLCIAKLTNYGKFIGLVHIPSDSTSPIFNLDFSPDGTSLVYEEYVGTLKKIDSDTGMVLGVSDDLPPSPTYTARDLKLTPLCSPNPTEYLLWQVENFNPTDAYFEWELEQSTPKQQGAQSVFATDRGVVGKRTFKTVPIPGVNRLIIYSPRGVIQDNTEYSLTQCVTLTPSFTPSPTPTLTPTLTPTPRPDSPAIYRPTTSTFHFPTLPSVTFGNPNDHPITGDWDGDGVDTLGVFDPLAGRFLLRNSNTPGAPDLSFLYGNPGDTPLAGHWTATATHDGVGTYRNTNGTLYLFLRNQLSTGYADLTAIVGNPGDLPIVGDWNGDGVDTVGLYRPDSTTFYLFNRNAPDMQPEVIFTLSGGVPIAGRWTGSGGAGVGFFADGVFSLKDTPESGVFDRTVVFGESGDVPLAGRWSP